MKGRISAIFMLALLIGCGQGQKSNLLDVNKVSTKAGLVSGKITDDKVVKIFLGIPFAAPPTGELRWKAPQAVEVWEGVRACTTPPASATQGKPDPFFCWSKEFLIPDEPISEDCLYLNVWTNAETNEDKLPVLVWIHGGGFNAGSGTVPLYDGEAMARKGIVFVTINYRLGLLGFLAHPELSAESENHISGNYGILDQITALKWVQDNISAFGGDPAHVTIAGQSAGAMSVNVLVASPLTKGLFNQAIAQSGSNFRKDPTGRQSLHTAEEAGQQLTERLGGVSINDLRTLPADSILHIQARYGIVVDNVVVPPIYDTFAAGKQNDVALLTGWNAGDGASQSPLPDSKTFKSNVEKQYGAQAEAYLKLFPASTDEEAYQSQKTASALSTGWGNYTWARLQAKTGTQKSYLYYFTRIPPGEPNYGAFHSAEFGYALHTLKYWDRPFIDVDYRLENIMSSYWANFAKTGNPNGEGLPQWPAFNQQSPEIIELGSEVHSSPLPFHEQLNFLDDVWIVR